MLGLRQKIFAGLAGAILSVGSASACSPGDPFESTTQKRGENCSVLYPQSDYDSVFLGEVGDFGRGFIGQSLSKNSVCASEAMSAVYDCNANKVIVYGGVDLAWGISVEQDRYNNNNPLTHLNKRISAKLRSGRHLSLLDISQRVNRAQLPINSIMDLNKEIRIDGRRVDLSCGCKLLYPELMEKSE